jgi:predicted metalloprotease with PDZ domain
MLERITGYILLFCLIVFCPQKVAAQNPTPNFSYHISIDLQNVTPDRDRIKVTIVPPALQGRVMRYVLPEYLPGVAGKVDAGRFVHQFYALDDKGFPLKVTKKGNNIIVMKMRKGATLKKIEYWIDDTWDDEKPKTKMSDETFNYVPQVAGTNIDAGNNFLLNQAFVFGYLEGYADIPYYISVIKPAELSASSALTITSENQTHDSYQVSSYGMLVDNPVMYCHADTCGFKTGNIYVSISVYSENGRVSARLVRRIIASQMDASSLFIKDIGERNYKLIFYFTTPFKTVLNANGNYGGLAHGRSAFYFLPELADEEELTSEIQRETSGDIMHMLSPLNIQVVNGNNNFLEPQISKAWWFCEGVNLYFDWLALLRDSFASEDNFMGAISAKIKLNDLAQKKPLTDLKSVQLMMKIPLEREEFRAKAMITALLLDIEMTEMSGGKMGLREAVLKLNSLGKFDPDSLEINLERLVDPKLAEFFRNYVDGIKPFPLISSFGKIGWAYAPETIDSLLTFGPFGLSYDDNLDVFFVLNCDTMNLFHLKDGDRIVSVNDIIVGSENFDEALHPVYSPRKDEEVQIKFIRNNQNVTAIAIPVVRTVVVEHLIRTDPAAGKDAVLLHQQIFVPDPVPH